MRTLLAALLCLLFASPVSAQRFVAVAFHDVVDDERDLSTDDISTPQLIAFLDWLRGNGWTSISLDDIDAARLGRRPLPPKAILLSFDDGYRSHYERVFPLLLAYRMHAMFALVGSWMDAPEERTVRYGDEDVPRSRFLSWEQAREMAASGLVEFASHSYALHHEVPGNTFGSRFPAAAAWAFDARSATWETDGALRARVRADLEHSKRLMQQHLGIVPRSLVWPYGRYSGPALTAAREAGFTFMFTLDPEPADASRPQSIPRLFPARNPKLDSLAEDVRFADPAPVTRRVACLDAAALRGEATLGIAIETLRRLGATAVVLDTDVDRATLSFVAWQLRTRAGVELFLRLDPQVRSLAALQDVVRSAPIDGVLIEPSGNLASATSARILPYAWTIRAARDAIDPANLDADGRRALMTWRAVVALRPGLRLALSTTSEPSGDWPSPAADWLLVAPSGDGLPALAKRIATRGGLAPDVTSRLILPVPPGNPGAAVRDIRVAQVQGATGLGICPALLPIDPALRAAFSASRFPRLP
jgi:peptidoglycan/xylan/chitin deacetylase (PgdA/CDA1 family)